jgi:hypothetical protein
MCLIKTSIARIRRVFQISVRSKSNDEKKIIPIFSNRKRELIRRGGVPENYSSSSNP